MEVSIKRRALKDFINKALKENRTYHSSDMAVVPAKDDEADTPIEASPQIAIQLSTDRPPVEDDEFIPVSREELALSAGEIAKAVPENQFEYFYRMLHKLLDKTLDINDKNRMEAIGLQEAHKLNEEDEILLFQEKYYDLLQTSLEDTEEQIEILQEEVERLRDQLQRCVDTVRDQERQKASEREQQLLDEIIKLNRQMACLEVRMEMLQEHEDDENE